ncbi:MAG: hypothetical protein ACR2LJ_03840 [Acidimicrobiales bacterium]
MPVVNPETGEPMSDDPDQENQDLAGGEGRGDNVSAHGSPSEGTGVSTGPQDDPAEAQPGGTLGDSGDDPGGSNATGGA